MGQASSTAKQQARRQARARFSLRKKSKGRPRFHVYGSNSNFHAQIIDDKAGATLAAASTLDKEVQGKTKHGGNVEAAKLVGALLAARAVKAGIDKVAFDRGAKRYHGRIKACADAAREAGLKF
ncbi:MAG: 50S ribosomal protein L18 [Dongiaceae bacterium]